MGVPTQDPLGVASPTALSRGKCRGKNDSTKDSGSIVYEGLLRYQSTGGRWKERWFVLDGSENRLIKCTTSGRQRSRSYGSVLGDSGGIRVHDVRSLSSSCTSLPAEAGLEVLTASGQRVRLLTKTENEEHAWVLAIQQLLHGFTKGVTERLVDRELLAGKYALVRELGRGASGIVSLYTYQGKPFAIKKFVPQKAKGIPNRLTVPGAGGRLRPTGMREGNAVKCGIPEEVRREIALLKKASQLPYVIKLHDVIAKAEEQQYYLVMEYMGGGAIAEWDSNRKCYVCSRSKKSLSLLDEKTVRLYMTNLLVGIQALHQNGLCHRDIKPENLMASEDRTMCKIGDLGIAHYFRENESGELTEVLDPDNVELWDVSVDKHSSGQESSGTAQNSFSAKHEMPRKAMLKSTKGTYQFLPPEALSGDEFDGFKADIWAIGVTLYVLMFGYLPFYSPDLVKLFEKIAKDPVIVPTSCHDEELQDLLRRILEKDPNKRISIESILEHKWLHRHVDSKALAQQVRALKRTPALQIRDDELGDAVSVLQVRFVQLSQAVLRNALTDVRSDEITQTSAMDRLGMTMNYRPRPIETGSVQLPQWLVAEVDDLAVQLHFDWCRAKVLDGWVHGLERDDAAHVHPLLVPLRGLPEEARARNRHCVEETLKCVVALGCRIKRPVAASPLRGAILPIDQVTLPWDMLMLVDLLAENSHEVWASGYATQGWKYAETFDAEAKTHPFLKPYMSLDEREKDWSRDGVSAVLKSCLCLGMTISCSREAPRRRAGTLSAWSCQSVL